MEQRIVCDVWRELGQCDIVHGKSSWQRKPSRLLGPSPGSHLTLHSDSLKHTLVSQVLNILCPNLTISWMLRLSSSKAQGCTDFWNFDSSCWELSDEYPFARVLIFQAFLRYFVLAKLATSSIRVNPSNAKAIFVQSTRRQRLFENHLNPVMLVFIG